MNKSKFDQQSSTLTFSDPTRKMEFTGERYVSGHVGPTQHAHHHRYLFSVGLCQGKDVLDIASGEGYGADLLARTAASVVGIDISESTIEFAKKTYERPGLQFLCGSVANIPLPDHSFDVVVSFETIEHLAEQEAALAEMKRVLRPDGILIISSPNRPIYSDKKHHKNPFHVRELDLEEFRNLLERHFPHVSVYSQSQLTGSMVFKNEGIEKDITVYATEDSLTYSIEDPVSVAQYFIAVAGIRELELEDGSILMNGEYVPRLQAENAWHKKQSQNERSRADKAEKLEEQFQALAEKTANILTEHGAALQDQRKALEERIDAARATLEAKLNRIGSAQSNLQETLFEVIAHQKVERASGFSARLSTLVDDTKYLLQFLKLQADAFRRYPLSRRKRRAFVQRRVESASIEYAQNIDIASKFQTH